jgi:ABC-2 type transport system permease protein
MSEKQPDLIPFGTKRIGMINWLGLWTLYKKEVWRFFKIFGQTILAPAITTFMFMMIFTLALSSAGGRSQVGIPYETFLAPGLVMMAILQNAYANTSSSFMTAKMQGNIVDLLMAPIGAGELIIAFTLAAVTRGVFIGLVVIITMHFFTDIPYSHIGALLYFGLAASFMLSFLGILSGIWAEKWDQAAAVQNFIIMPLSFLSGTFYSIDRLSGFWYNVSQYNPFFYLIDGFRYGMIGKSEADPMIGVAFTLSLTIILWFLCYLLIRSGYKLKA